MAKPATLNATVALVRKSRLVEEDRLRAFLAGGESGPPPDLTPVRLLQRMVAAGLLTPFQAEQLHYGKYQGFRLGNYLIRDRIGKGGMGQVYLADHLGLGRPVAIKVLRPAAQAAPLARERFVREAVAAAKLSHPNIVRVLDVNTDVDPPYLVMEYIDGVSLQAAVARFGRFSGPEAAACGRQIALGLQHAFESGLVHRDIKPANVLVDRRGTAKILDLGIVHVVGETLTDLANTDMILGTVEYLSPEQAYSTKLDTRADIYSLGATLYFLLAGHPPFPDGDVRTKILKLYSAEPDPLAALRPDLDPDLTRVVHRMLAKNPDARFQTPADVVAALLPWAPPAAFPDRLFGETAATRCDDASQTLPVPMALLRPPVESPTPVPAALAAECGTVELSHEPTAPALACELTLRTQIDRAAEPPPAAPPADPWARAAGWAVVAAVVLAAGAVALWAALAAGS